MARHCRTGERLLFVVFPTNKKTHIDAPSYSGDCPRTLSVSASQSGVAESDRLDSVLASLADRVRAASYAAEGHMSTAKKGSLFHEKAWHKVEYEADLKLR